VKKHQLWYLIFGEFLLTLKLRAWTRGWDFFSVSQNFVYHFYVTDNAKRTGYHWNDHEGWYKAEAKSLSKIRHIVGYEQSDKFDLSGPFGVGTFPIFQYLTLKGKDRTVEQFEIFAHLKYSNLSYAENATQFLPQTLVTLNQDYEIQHLMNPKMNILTKGTALLVATRLTGTNIRLVRHPESFKVLFPLEDYFIQEEFEPETKIEVKSDYSFTV
jgi:hypothetical protein